MLRALFCVLAMLTLSACVSEPTDPSFIGARAFNPEDAAKTRVSLGLTYLKNGNFSQAKFNLDKALEFAPRNGQAHFAMAFYYQQVDEVVLAEESYEKALTFSRNDPDIVNSYGAFLCQQGKYEKAKGYFLEAVNSRNYVSTAETYENLAICSQSQGKNQEAIEFFISALNHQPTRPQSLYLLSNLYVEEQQWEDAKRTLFKYERNAQVSPESLYLQFQIAQGLGDTKAALGYGEIMKSMFPDHPNTQKYLAQMGKFKPSATITRKIRTQASSTETPRLDAQTLVAQVLRDSQSADASASNQNANEVLFTNTEQLPLIVIKDTTIQEEQTVPDPMPADEVPALSPDLEPTLAAALRVGSPEVQQDDKSAQLKASNEQFHVVQAKENLYRISLKYNVKMKTLLEWNELEDASEIKIGTTLRVRDPNNNE